MASPIFCDNCRSLHPAEGLTHFDLLGLAPRYELDAAVVRQKYLQISRGVHPDQHADAADAEASLRLTARLNEAYRVLSDPVLRAEYLLELAGGPSAAASRAVLDGVLAQSMLLREELSEALTRADAAALECCRATAQGEYDRLRARIAALAARLPGEAPLRDELRATLNSIKYYQKVLAEAPTPLTT